MPAREPGLGAWELPNLDQDLRVTFRYSVRFTRDLLRPYNSTLLEAIGDHGPSRLLVVVDGGLAAARPSLLDELASYCLAHRRRLELVTAPLVVPGGEAAKNDRQVVEQVREAIERDGVDRHAYVVAIGGGAVLDAVGYAAATAHRGVRLVRVPSTVLAQNDSAVGIKNGINAYGKKNFVGSFVPPYAVIADFELLTSLSDRDWRAGISEAVKVALIKDPGFFTWLERQAHCLRSRSLTAMAWLVHRCAQLHLRHIAGDDPFERGSSRPLDFGHWAAHKLEQLSDHDLRHGEAVAIGIALDATYAKLVGRLPATDWQRILGMFDAVDLPVWTPELQRRRPDGRAAVLDGIGEFREHLGGRLTVTLLERIGTGVEVHALDEDVVLEAIRVLRRRSHDLLDERQLAPDRSAAIGERG